MSKRVLRNDGERGNDSLWSQALRAIEAEISPAAFSAWIEPLRFMPPAAPADASDPIDRGGVDASHPRLFCTSQFQLQQLDRRYRSLIERALGSSVELILVADNVN